MRGNLLEVIFPPSSSVNPGAAVGSRNLGNTLWFGSERNGIPFPFHAYIEHK